MPTVMLRELTGEDHELLRSWLKDPDAERFVGGETMLETAVADDPLSRIDSFVALDSDGVPVGLITCDHTLSGHAVVTLLVDPARRGQRYGTAILTALLEHPGYEDVSFTGEVSPANPRSLACVLAAGFDIEDEDGDGYVTITYRRDEFAGWL